MSIQGDDKTGYELSGNLTYATVPDLFKQNQLKISNSTTLNLSDVQRVDSAGLALLVEWSCLARAGKKDLILKNVPASLKSLIEIGGLREILSISDQ